MSFNTNKFFLQSNLAASKKSAFPSKFPRLIEKKEQNSLLNDNILNTTILQTQGTDYHHNPNNRPNSQTKNINKLSNRTNERFLKTFLKPKNFSPLSMEARGNLFEQPKKINNSFQIVSREIKKPDSRERSTKKVIRSHGRDTSNNSMHNNNNNSNINSQHEKKESLSRLNKANNLMKIYNPTANTQQPIRKTNTIKLNAKKDSKEKKNSEEQHTSILNGYMVPSQKSNENPSDFILSMSFGKEGFENALGIDIKHLIDKGLNNNFKKNAPEDSSGKNINIIGNVNYENINFNFTFSNNDVNDIRKMDMNPVPILTKQQTVFKRRVSKTRDKPQQDQKSVLFEKNTNNQTDISFNELKIKNNLAVNPAENYPLNLRETPTFTLPLHMYKEQNEQNEKKEKSSEMIEKKENESKTKQMIEAPNIYSNDLLLDDLMEDLKKNGLFKYVNEPIHLSSLPALDSPTIPNNEKIKKNIEPDLNSKIVKKTDLKSLLIDFDEETDEDNVEDEVILANKNITPIEKPNNFKIIKTKNNMEVIDLNDL